MERMKTSGDESEQRCPLTSSTVSYRRTKMVNIQTSVVQQEGENKTVKIPFFFS